MVQGRVNLPDVILAHSTDEILDVRLSEVLVIMLNQLGVNGGHCHEDVDPRSLGVQEPLPNLEQRKQELRWLPCFYGSDSWALWLSLDQVLRFGGHSLLPLSQRCH